MLMPSVCLDPGRQVDMSPTEIALVRLSELSTMRMRDSKMPVSKNGDIRECSYKCRIRLGSGCRGGDGGGGAEGAVPAEGHGQGPPLRRDGHRPSR